MNIRIAGMVDESIVDGPGFRCAIFTQGCPHLCPGCHNPQTHDFSGGRSVSTASIIRAFEENPLLDGITLSGGEPFCQVPACAELARAARKAGLSVWCYTGYTWETLIAMPQALELLQAIDVLADGPFILAQRTLDKRFRGSKNQRLIDVPRSLVTGKIALNELN